MWKLSGTIKAASNGAPLQGATVKIVDGPNASQSTTTDNAGSYSFVALQQSGFTVQASASGYTALSMGVSLTVDTVQDFALVRLTVANLRDVPGSVSGIRQADGSYTYSVPGINVGDGCAGSISGTMTFADGNGLTTAAIPWSLPAGTIVRPNQQFTFTVNVAATPALSTKTYSNSYQFTTVSCP
jgi:hypothetical protein